MSECSTFISGSPAASRARRARWVARRMAAALPCWARMASPYRWARKVRSRCTRSDPGLMLGYLGQPEVTARHFKGDWFVTGDQGHDG